MRRDPSGLAWGNGPFGPRYLELLQPAWKFDRKVVEEYTDLIAYGERPMGIVYYFDGFLSFLLDGHHKAAAYLSHGLDMPCLTIYPFSLVFSGDRAVYWAERGGSWAHTDDDSRLVKPEELPPALAESLVAASNSMLASRPEYISEKTEKRYLRLLGASG